jgi:hypothetical protein
MSLGQKRWNFTGKHASIVPAFEPLRFLPRHLLLAELQKCLLATLSGAAGMHFQGLAQAAKFHRGAFGLRTNAVCAKLRLVDDAHHLLEHLTPESCSLLVSDIQSMVAGSSEATLLVSEADVGGSSDGCGSSLACGASSESRSDELFYKSKIAKLVQRPDGDPVFFRKLQKDLSELQILAMDVQEVALDPPLEALESDVDTLDESAVKASGFLSDSCWITNGASGQDSLAHKRGLKMVAELMGLRRGAGVPLQASRGQRGHV